jgi:NAD(P)-dependent dehydrogenase (short-subunit alcohol dehydrogenase family)
MAAQLLIADGHEVVLHARSERRADEALAKAAGAATVLVGDLSSSTRRANWRQPRITTDGSTLSFTTPESVTARAVAKRSTVWSTSS